jgi:hypothetical protein
VVRAPRRLDVGGQEVDTGKSERLHGARRVVPRHDIRPLLSTTSDAVYLYSHLMSPSP